MSIIIDIKFIQFKVHFIHKHGYVTIMIFRLKSNLNAYEANSFCPLQFDSWVCWNDYVEVNRENAFKEAEIQHSLQDK